MKKLLCINTVNTFKNMIYDPFLAPFQKENPDIEIITITDDTLLTETRACGGVTDGVIRRVFRYAECGLELGADCIMCTCTSVNKASNYLKEMLPVPIFNIEEPTAQAAVDHGKKIGVLATLSSSPGAIISVMESYAKKIGKEIEIVTNVVEGAFEILSAGDREEHDRLVNVALENLAKEVDTVVFAQISMSLLPHGDVGVPIYKIGTMGLEHAKKLMEN